MTEFFGSWSDQAEEDGDVVETTETVETITTTTKKTRLPPVGPRHWPRPWSWLRTRCIFAATYLEICLTLDLHMEFVNKTKKIRAKIRDFDGWNTLE